MPAISVVMSCYNSARWLNEAIDSVLLQTFQNFELILVDDGSTDETGAIIDRYRAKDRRVVGLAKDNSGLADSLNAGIGKARGEWIARLDADDICEPDRLEKQAEFLREYTDVVLLGSGFLEIDERGQSVKAHRYPSDHHGLVQNLERMKRMFPHSSAVFRRDVANEVGRYNTRFAKSQDWELWLRIAERGRISCLRHCLARVRKHRGQISRSADGRSQLLLSTAASTCHFLRLDGQPDPSAESSVAAWNDFLDWVERRLAGEHAVEIENAWADARNRYLAAENRMKGIVGLVDDVLRSGYAIRLSLLKAFGSSLPQRLAGDWIKRSCAAS